MGWDDVVLREWKWLGFDPPGSGAGSNAVPNPWTVNPPPPLQAPVGPLDLVSAYYRSPVQRFRALYITRTRTTTNPLTEGAALYEWRHFMSLVLTWSFETSTGQLDTEAQAFETAIAAIEARIRGPVADKSHGGQFKAAGVGDQGRDLIDVLVGDGRPEALLNAYEAGLLLTTTITYPIYEAFYS